MKPEHIARFRNIQTLLKEIDSEIEFLITGRESEFEEAAHVDDKQDEIDDQETEMPIEYFKAGDTNIRITATCHELGKVGSFSKKDGSHGSVRKIVFKDGTGFITIPLWNDQIEKIVPVEGREYDIKAWKVEEYPKQSGKLQLVLGTEGHILPAGQTELKE